MVEDDAKLEERVHFIHETIGTDALVEEYIEGRELYVGILGDKRLEVFPIWELSFDGMPEESRRSPPSGSSGASPTGRSTRS